MKILVLVLALAVATSACSSSSANGGASSERKPDSKADAEVVDGKGARAEQELGADGADSPFGAGAAIKMAGDLVVLSGGGGELCTGSIVLLASVGGPAGFGFEFPEGTADCLGMKVNLAKMLKAFTASGPLSGQGETAISSKDGIIYAAKIFGAAFEPPRPLLVGPIIQDLSKYEGIDAKTTHAVTIPDPKTGESRTASGSLHLKVLETGGRIDRRIAGVDGELDQVMHFEMTADGFDGVDKMSGFLFDKLEFFINARPLAFPRFVIEAPIEDLIGADMLGGDTAGVLGIASALVGTLHIEFNMREFSAN